MKPLILTPTLDERLLTRLYYGEDALSILKQLPNKSVHAICTSPPYFQIRDYSTAGQSGLEATPQEYCQRLVQVCGELFRVLRDDGSLWLNLGDSFAKKTYPDGIKKGELIGIPWMVVFALRSIGWYLRSDVIWSKTNPMTEGNPLRVTRSHEYIFMFTKQATGYYYDSFPLLEPVDNPGKVRPFRDAKEHSGSTMRQDNGRLYIPLSSRNKRSVWTIPTGKFAGAHFAVYPEELVSLIIQAATSPCCCSQCGEPKRRIADVRESGEGDNRIRHRYTKGWEFRCDCHQNGISRCLVLDPFSGSGTTGKVAVSLGRSYSGIDINAEYLPMAVQRITGEVMVDESTDDEISLDDLFGV